LKYTFCNGKEVFTISKSKSCSTLLFEAITNATKLGVKLAPDDHGSDIVL